MSSPSAPSVPLPTSPDPAEPTSSSDTVDALISGLRASLASSQTLVSTQATRLARLSDLEVEHQQLKDQHAFIVAAKDAVEAQLRDEVRKREEAEERVESLRGQVESARRGVMTLQKQEKDRKRMSMMGAPAGLGLVAGEEVLEADKEEKLARRTSVMRPSYTHRRVSSQSEPDAPMVTTTLSTSPNASNMPRTGLRELRLAPQGSREIPQSSQLPSPLPYEDPYSARTSPPRTSPSSEALVAARAEADRLRAQLASVTSRLADSEDARMASETVLKALREFVGGASGVVDLNDPMTMEELKGISLPPLPTDPDEPAPAPEQEQKKPAGWGFNKLFAKSTLAVPATPGSPASNAAEAPATPHILSPPRSIRTNSTPRVSPLPTTAELPLNENAVNAMPAQTPLASFVASWTKTVPPGTPAAAPATTRSFSSFFRKGAPAECKEKDLPPSPVREGSDAGSVGAERVDDAKNEGLGLGLEPSPMGRDAGGEERHEQEVVVKEDVAGGEAEESTPKLSPVDKVPTAEDESEVSKVEDAQGAEGKAEAEGEREEGEGEKVEGDKP